MLDELAAGRDGLFRPSGVIRADIGEPVADVPHLGEERDVGTGRLRFATVPFALRLWLTVEG